jgi:hypothetical protein
MILANRFVVGVGLLSERKTPYKFRAAVLSGK